MRPMKMTSMPRTQSTMNPIAGTQMSLKTHPARKTKNPISIQLPTPVASPPLGSTGFSVRAFGPNIIANVKHMQPATKIKLSNIEMPKIIQRNFILVSSSALSQITIEKMRFPKLIKSEKIVAAAAPRKNDTDRARPDSESARAEKAGSDGVEVRAESQADMTASVSPPVESLRAFATRSCMENSGGKA